MEYDHDIENIYLSVVNDQRAYRDAKDFLRYIKAGIWDGNKCNINQPLNRKRPINIELRKLAKIAGVEDSYNNICMYEMKLFTLWLKIADYIDPDFIQLDKPEPKVEVINSITKLGEAYQKAHTPLPDQTKLYELQTAINQHMVDAASYFVKVNHSFNETRGIKMPIINNVTYFKGTDIKVLNEDQLIKAIKDLESEVESLKAIKVTSKKVASNIEEIEEAINLVVAELDSRS